MSKAEAIAGAVDATQRLSDPCVLCGARCEARRSTEPAGWCRAGVGLDTVVCASHTLHFGEEPPLVGRGGSGTVFFAHCNLRCVFCQNYQISHDGLGRRIDCDELARVFLELQDQGAENINMVTPTHYVHPILRALRTAVDGGLRLPVVYNTNGYESVELVDALKGVVDIYMPDIKYAEPEPASRYSGAANYPEVAKAAVSAMYRQAGPLQTPDGVAWKGTLIRHLVLPGNLAGSYDLLLWMKDEGMTGATLSIMSQYAPRYRAAGFPELNRTISGKEYRDVVQFAVDLGFDHVLAQGSDSPETYLPDFTRGQPFERED